jgi:hypothetical protein
MKTLTFPGKKVKDVSGLYYDLLKGHYAVENVGTGPDCTYIFLEEVEDKDPTSLVDAWMDKPAMSTGKNAILERQKLGIQLGAEARKEREARAAAREAARETTTEIEEVHVTDLFLPPAAGSGMPGASGEVFGASAPRKESRWAKIFKVFRK